MKYFVIDTTIRDGDFEYLSQSPVAAENEAAAVKIQEDEAKDWTGANSMDDIYSERGYEINVRAEITEAEYQVINKYIY